MPLDHQFQSASHAMALADNQQCYPVEVITHHIKTWLITLKDKYKLKVLQYLLHIFAILSEENFILIQHFHIHLTEHSTKIFSCLTSKTKFRNLGYLLHTLACYWYNRKYICSSCVSLHLPTTKWDQDIRQAYATKFHMLIANFFLWFQILST